MTEEKKAAEDEKSRQIASEVLSDGTIVEMLYDKHKNTTSLAAYKDGKVEKKDHIVDNGVVLKPLSAKKKFLRDGVALFPSAPTKYESQEALIEEIRFFIHEYLSVSDFFEKIASYYVLFSWIHDDFNELPYLRGLGDYGTGKSRFLQIVGSICYRPIFAGGATTTSPIFRILDEIRGTLILDEADFKASDTTTDIVKILNSGFMKGMPVLRSESNSKKSFDVKSFNVFGPKIIATRQLYKDTALESRMITEDMNLNFPREDVPYNLPNEFWDEALKIRNKLLMFRFENKGKNKLNPKLENRDIEPRLNQIAVPLMSIIDDPKVVEEIRQYITEYNEKIKTDRTLGYNYQVLDAICHLLDEGHFEPTMQQVAGKFNFELSPAEIVTPRKMGYLVRKMLDIKTKKTRNGYVITKDNAKKIEILRKRYRIDENREEDENNVNDVNNDKPMYESEISVGDLPI